MTHLSIIKQCCRALLYLAYPPICLHCGETIEEKHAIFCSHCFPQLELIDHNDRCPHCFSSDFCPERYICQECSQHAPVLNRIASAFDYMGPAATLVKGLKYGNQPYLAKGAAAYMAMQFIHLNWPVPDVIIPVPLPLTRWIQRGYNQSLLLAQELSQYLDRPVYNALTRTSGDFSQAGLSRQQRRQLDSQSFQVIEERKLEDQCLLLVDDVMTTGSTLRCCAETLYQAFPASIYGLTVCRAIK